MNTMLRKALWSTLTVLLALNGCAATIHDFKYCSPYPVIGGASCDNFLTHQPQRLTPAQWQAQIDAWARQGLALECTNSLAVAQNKAELEKFCTVYKCTVEMQKEVATLWGNMDRAERLARKVLEVAAPLTNPTEFETHGIRPIQLAPNQ